MQCLGIYFNVTKWASQIFSQDDTNILGIKCTETKTKLTITSTTSMSGDVIGYHCGGTE